MANISIWSCYQSWIVEWLLPILWQLFAFITGQLVRPCCIWAPSNEDSKCNKCCKLFCPFLMASLMMILTSVFVFINGFPLGVFLTNWINCTETNEFHNVCYTLQFETDESEVNINDHLIVLKDNDEDNNRFDKESTQQYLQKFEDLTRVFILFTTTGSFLSYVLFVLALWCLYFRQTKIVMCPNCCSGSCWTGFRLCCCCTQKTQIDNSTVKPLDPFNDNGTDYRSSNIETVYQIMKPKIIEPQNTSTLLQGERLSHFTSWFATGLLLHITLFLLFYIVYYSDKDNHTISLSKRFENTALFFYAYSLFCTFVSCFIFSKLMYGVQRKCEELEVYVYHINEEYDNILDDNEGKENDVFKYVRDILKERADKATEATKKKVEECKKVADKYNNWLAEEKSENERNQLVAKKQALDNNILETDFDISNISDLLQNAEAFANEAQTLVPENNSNNCISCRKASRYEKRMKFAVSDIEGYKSVLEAIENERHKIFTNREDQAARRLIVGAVEVENREGEVENREGEEERKRRQQMALKYLKERDHHFVKRAVVTMEWFQLWFLIHWVFHILSAFLAIGLFLDGLALHVKAQISHPKQGVNFHPAQIGFLFMLSVVELFQLIYPCLRAANVTRTRQRLIQKLAEESHKFVNIPQGEVMFEFIKSMRERRFSFRLRILCANITFNLNIAYISIIFGFVGVVVSLVTTLTA